jgi:chromosome segregation ATPase
MAASGLLALAACKGGGIEGQQPADPVKAEQKKAEDDFKRASDAQKKASDEQQQAKNAQADVEKARKDLQEKEQKAQKQQSESQQAQASATTEAKKAQTEGVQAQQRAQDALQQQQAARAQDQQQAAQPSAAGSAAGTSEMTGKLARATSSEIQLENNPQPLKIDSSTQVTLDGQAASAEQLPAGADVRASFRTDAGEARAIKIEAKTK